MINFFKATRKGGTISAVLTRELADKIARPFKFVKIWTCPCGAQLKIRAKDNRENGDSNFAVDTHGKATLEHGELNWNGLAEEKGWHVNPVKCPACINGMTVEAYKASRRK